MHVTNTITKHITIKSSKQRQKKKNRVAGNTRSLHMAKKSDKKKSNKTQKRNSPVSATSRAPLTAHAKANVGGFYLKTKQLN